jgi:membrane-bound serine protease (ClpP class)
MKPIPFLFFLIFLFIPSFALTANAERPNVLLVEITDTIDHSTVEILKESVQQAEIENSEAIILLLDTPGGGLQQTFEIADLILASRIPVIGYVYPTGAAAWSAGTFILVSTHRAAMANHTIIGSSQPVEVTLEGTRVVNDSKTINALVEWIQERSRMYERNETLAAEFITINRNVNATLAKKYGVIEFISSSIDQLLEDIDGEIINTSAGIVTLHTKDAVQIKYVPSLRIYFLTFISNPMLTSLLFMLGIFALLFGISSPGYGAEVFGVIAILLSLIGSGFAVSMLSLIFIIVGGLLLLIEIFATPGFGVIGIGGIISLVLGSIFLVPSYSTREWVISMDWINQLIIILLVAAVLVAIFFAFLLYKVIRIRKKKKAIGTFIGEKAKTIDKITPDKIGYVRFKGEYWQAKSDTIIEPNTNVIIIEKDGTTLIIKPVVERTKH